jgi:branched-chain amino acid aminotransferase
MTSNERLAYVNGNFIIEAQASVSIRDKGLVYGDCVFDTARTFDGKIFRLDAHLDRLYRNLDYAQIDPGVDQAEMAAITEELVQRNLPILRSGEDYWVTQRVTSGAQQLDGELTEQGSTVVVDCIPLPLRARARLFENGIEAAVAERIRISPKALSANIKSNNYLNMMLAQREVQEKHPGAWALMCDENGDIAEGAGCNFFIVKNGEVYTPTSEYVLDGVSRQVIIELCEKLSIPIHQSRVTIDDALNADEGFFTSTSLCICPVRLINEQPIGKGIPGSVTAKLTQGFKDEVEFDFVQQYLDQLSDTEGSTGL